MGPIAQTLREQFRFSQFIMGLVLPDLTNDDALKRTRNGEGASVSWVVGHLCSYRYQVMALLKGERPNPFEAFTASSAGDDLEYQDIAELLKNWNGIHAELEAVLADVSDEQLLAPMPTADGPHAEKSVLDTMTFFAWHEAYHLGTVGLMRLENGYTATAEMVMALNK